MRRIRSWMSGTEMGSPPCVSGSLFRTHNGSPILELDPNREIVAIDVEGNVNVLWVQIWTGEIVETLDFAAKIGRRMASRSPLLPSSRFRASSAS